METLKQSFGRRLRALREARGHSREFLAQKAKIEPTSIYRAENGKQWVAPLTLERICRFYGVSPAIFFTDDVVRIEPTPFEALEIISTALQALMDRPALPDFPGVDPDKLEQLFGVLRRRPGAIDHILLVDDTPPAKNKAKRGSA